ncbi:hypothetical protein J658_2498 [Acinetobacter baumannii 573719]|jgi:hypothetical protein|nr:hypothetical protein J658_2498 [Acinetobacter baumannii 573719]
MNGFKSPTKDQTHITFKLLKIFIKILKIKTIKKIKLAFSLAHPKIQSLIF